MQQPSRENPTEMETLTPPSAAWIFCPLLPRLNHPALNVPIYFASERNTIQSVFPTFKMSLKGDVTSSKVRFSLIKLRGKMILLCHDIYRCQNHDIYREQRVSSPHRVCSPPADCWLPGSGGCHNHVNACKCPCLWRVGGRLWNHSLLCPLLPLFVYVNNK